jgi:hypothetical protein
MVESLSSLSVAAVEFSRSRQLRQGALLHHFSACPNTSE